MAYSPSQTAMARASIVGQAAGDIRNQFINASQNIRSIIKDKNINEKIDAAYKNAEDNFVQQAVASGIDETSARIKSQHFFRQFPMEGVDTETRIKNLLASGMRAEDYLSRMQTQAEEKRLTQQKATSAEAAVSGGREYGMPSQIQAPGGSFTEETVTETAPPAQYQEEAMSTYAQMQAQGRAPVQPVKELQQQAAIGALPKRPEPPKPMTEYQKESLRLKKQANDIARMKASKGDTEQLDKNLRYLQDRQDDISADEMKYNEKLTKLRQAKVKINAGKKLNDDMISFLTEENINATNLTGPQADMKQLDDAINNYRTLLNTVEDLKVSADESVKALIETKSLSKAISKGRAKKEEVTTERAAQNVELLKDAIRHIKTRVSPSVIKTGTVNDIINQLPTEYKSAFQEKVNEMMSEGYDDLDIRRWLGQ